MNLSIRPITKNDNSAVAAVIRAVMPEFGANGPGFAIHDPEVDDMHAAYRKPGASYFVVTDGERVLGGGGVAKLEGGDEGTCELKKMYFLPEARGRGAGRQLIELLLKEAKRLGYQRCYLETLTGMDQAKKLYEAMGFERLCKPMGNTGHFGCDSWYVKEL